jgi:hypothetical protein
VKKERFGFAPGTLFAVIGGGLFPATHTNRPGGGMNAYDPDLLEMLENPHLAGADDDQFDGVRPDSLAEQGISQNPAGTPGNGAVG